MSSPAHRDLAEDTPIDPPPQPHSFPPVNVPEPIPESEENEVEDMLENSPTRKVSIYSRRAAAPVFSPADQASKTTTYFTDRSPIAPPAKRTRTSWIPSGRITPPAEEAEETEYGGPSTPQNSARFQEPPKSAPPATTGFGKRIIPMSTGGGIVSIPGSFTPKRVTQTFTGNGMTSSSPGITPNYTGQGPFGAPKRLTPNLTGGSWGTGGRVECPRCGKAVYHAEGVSPTTFRS